MRCRTNGTRELYVAGTLAGERAGERGRKLYAEGSDLVGVDATVCAGASGAAGAGAAEVMAASEKVVGLI